MAEDTNVTAKEDAAQGKENQAVTPPAETKKSSEAKAAAKPKAKGKGKAGAGKRPLTGAAKAAAEKKAKAAGFEARAQEQYDAKAAAEAKAAYAAITDAEKGGEVPTYSHLGEGPLRLRFADGDTFVPHLPAQKIDRTRLIRQGRRALLDIRIDLPSQGPSARVREAWLIDVDGKGVRCAIGDGLPTGNGAVSAIPAGHLIF